MRMLGWSARGYDGVSRSPDKIVKAIMRDILPGTIILLHEGKRDPSGSSVNLVVIERLLQKLAEHRYSCIIPACESL